MDKAQRLHELATELCASLQRVIDQHDAEGANEGEDGDLRLFSVLEAAVRITAMRATGIVCVATGCHSVEDAGRIYDRLYNGVKVAVHGLVQNEWQAAGAAGNLPWPCDHEGHA